MINWKVLKDSQLKELLFAKVREDEVVLVDPTADPRGIAFLLFEADKVFSTKQLSRFKNVTPTELEVVIEKLNDYGRELEGSEDEDFE